MSTTETLRGLLDGPYPETRERVRWWLSQPGNEPVDDLPMEEHRERVLAWMRELASQGDTGMRLSRGSTAARTRRAAASPPSRRSPWATSRCSSSAACSSASSAARSCISAREAPRALPARRGVGGAPRLLRDDRDRPRLQRPGARDDRDLRPRDRRVRHPHARRRRAQGLHRQRRARRAHGRGLRPAARRRREAAACTRCSCRSATRTARRCPASGSRTAAPSSGSTASTTAGSGSTTCASRARTCSTSYAQVESDGTYFSPIENPTKRFFTMIGTLIQGRISVCGASISASKVALTIAVRRALGAAPVRRPGRARGAADGLPHAPAAAAPGAGQDLRAVLRPAAAGRRAARGVHEHHENERERRKLETLAAGVKAIATWHASETIQSCREACGGARLPAHQPLRVAEGRHRRVHDLRGRQHDPAAARGQEPADRLQGRLRRARPARDGAVRRRPGARRC